MKNKLYLLIFVFFDFFSCEKYSVDNNQYKDPHIIFSSRRWWNYDIFIGNILDGKITQLTKNKWIDFNPSISRDGKKLSFISDRDGNREIYITELEWLDGYSQWRGNELKNISNTFENEWTPVFSPIEDKIVYTAYFPENDNYDIFIMNYDGTEKKNLTNTSTYEKFPQFSPDGTFLIYQGWQSGKMELFFLSVYENNTINLTKSIKSNDIISHGNSFSPSGESIVFSSDRNGNKDIYLMNINGDSCAQITSDFSDDYEPTFSPDGESILFTSERDGNKEIYRFSLISRTLKNLTTNNGDDWNARFYPDGKKIVFQSSRDGNWEIYKMNFDGSMPSNLTNHVSTDYSFVILTNK